MKTKVRVTASFEYTHDDEAIGERFTLSEERSYLRQRILDAYDKPKKIKVAVEKV